METDVQNFRNLQIYKFFANFWWEFLLFLIQKILFFRVTAQTIIPGILEREQEQSVVYGSIDFGKTVVTSEVLPSIWMVSYFLISKQFFKMLISL